MKDPLGVAGVFIGIYLLFRGSSKKTADQKLKKKKICEFTNGREKTLY